MISGDKSFNQLQGSHSFTYHQDICCKMGICNDNSAQLSSVPYTQYSSDNRSPLNPSEYNKNIHFYGRLKLCLQPNVSVTTNRSSQFKCHDVAVMANHAEGLIILSKFHLDEVGGSMNKGYKYCEHTYLLTHSWS
jgi:hypothetical protein